MGKFLKTEVNKKMQEKVWQYFLNNIQKMPMSTIEEILNKLLSSQEKTMLVRRLTIAFLLGQKKKSKEISQVLGVSRQTICTVRRSLLGDCYKTYRFSPKQKSYKNTSRPKIKSLEKSWIDDLNIATILNAFLSKNVPRVERWK